MNDPLCFFCKHWTFYGGENDWSDVTPGMNASMDCDKKHYGPSFRIQDTNEAEFRNLILKARKCPDYQQAKDKT